MNKIEALCDMFNIHNPQSIVFSVNREEIRIIIFFQIQALHLLHEGLPYVIGNIHLAKIHV